ncbi:hypothetical protein [Aquimarina sp. 2201CG5-10]|uniref:hypothetical protein n=1 Tax=Aquimarina callyspongiae TaxID=3098150 RepID=UPI002AB44F04|nr:hypothetical protein [Aquimarina sp. 2201CG5-10]MDY8135064.1 hypothetical protein [Aquimarina sp. 2201CG5-10]
MIRLALFTALVFLSALFNFSYCQQNDININEGTGTFTLEGGLGHEEKEIVVHYYKPKKFTKKSKILIVIPGSGRNGDSYRDSWIEEAEKHNILILSPSYSEKNYPYEDYHLGGIVSVLNTRENIKFIKNSNQVFLDEDKVSIKVNSDASQWIYNDFDRLFDIAVKHLKSSQKRYDIFGHSAGGQILHRFVIFHPKSKANRIIAANSGSYTLTDFETGFPFGIKNTHLSDKNLKKSFSKKLTIYVGELDNENEKGGILLRSKTVDKQGLHRLARAKFFFKTAKAKAKELGYKFNWSLKIIAGVGHNQRKMGNDAGVYLYE